jgi:hypothetical protein
MRSVSLAFAMLFVSSPVLGQPGTPVIAPVPLPEAPSPAEPALPGGNPVSQPLQPVELPPPAKLPELIRVDPNPDPIPAIRPSTVDREAKTGKVLGNWWDGDELLIWWPKAQPLPPLVTGSRGALPVLGASTTSVLVGSHTMTTQDIAGYRLVHGWSLNEDDTVGFEGRYFFTGTRTLSQAITDLGNDRVRAFGLPFINALTGREDVVNLARPGLSSALTTVSVSNRVQGAEANLIANLYASTGIKVHAIAGYRFFQVNEGLRVESQWLQYPTAASSNLQTLGMIADQIDGHNEFHGGQVGLMADLNRGIFYIEMTGKAAIGTNFEMVRREGVTDLITANYPIPLLQSFHGGVYSQGTNMGQFTRPVFAVVPEAIFKAGLKLGDRGRIFIGYNFLFLSNAVRPGDQIDRTLNPTQIPFLSHGVPFAGPERPQATFVQSSFWTQGLTIGFETRF